MEPRKVKLPCRVCGNLSQGTVSHNLRVNESLRTQEPTWWKEGKNKQAGKRAGVPSNQLSRGGASVAEAPPFSIFLPPEPSPAVLLDLSQVRNRTAA